jgi:GNAT superfamily N-acetyltransferase
MLIVRPFTIDEWPAYRALRLAALAEAPYAFGSTLAEALARGDEDWRNNLAARVQFVAELDGEHVGMAGAIVDDDPDEPDLVSMWVAPSARGRGVGDELVQAVLGWARDAGYAAVGLWVYDTNPGAEKLYRRNGFVRTGRAVAPAPPDERVDLRMRAELRTAATLSE